MENLGVDRADIIISILQIRNLSPGPKSKTERETEFWRWVQLSLEVSLFDASIFSFGLNSWLKRDRSQKAVLGAGFCGIRVRWSSLAEGS